MIVVKFMRKIFCKICDIKFSTESKFQLVCSDQCRSVSYKRSRDKYKKSEKGVATAKRWNMNPKKKEIHKKHMDKPEAKAKATARILRLTKTVPYYRQMKRLKDSKAYKELRREMLIKFGICFNCHSEDDLTIDHIIPMSMGGAHEIDNLQVLCRSCNSRKKQDTIRYELPKM